MKIGVIQASSQVSKNAILYELTKAAAVKDEVINFGCFDNEKETYSYIHISLLAGILLAGKAVDFIVTGCSSGQGLMLACNNMPGVICGYAPTPQDAFLFGRINNGNAVSVPLGFNYGWSGELNLRYTLEALFEEPFGIGYPSEDAGRKQADTTLLKAINSLSKKSITEILDHIDQEVRDQILKKQNVIEYVLSNGKEKHMINWVREHRKL